MQGVKIIKIKILALTKCLIQYYRMNFKLTWHNTKIYIYIYIYVCVYINLNKFY